MVIIRWTCEASTCLSTAIRKMWIAINLVEVVQQNFRMQRCLCCLKYCNYNFFGRAKSFVTEAAHVRVRLRQKFTAPFPNVPSSPRFVRIVDVVPLLLHFDSHVDRLSHHSYFFLVRYAYGFTPMLSLRRIPN